MLKPIRENGTWQLERNLPGSPGSRGFNHSPCDKHLTQFGRLLETISTLSPTTKRVPFALNLKLQAPIFVKTLSYMELLCF